MPEFVPGHRLCRDFYQEVVAPAVGVPHAAGLLGPGSDVLGYDTERSTDHDWGPRCTVFVTDESTVDDVRPRVRDALPETYHGWPVSIGRDGQPHEPHVEVDTLPSWVRAQVGWDLLSSTVSTTDWLLLPQQRLLGITQGPVFADHDGALRSVRRRLAWYPQDVWWWMLACQWRRLAQEEAFVHRAAEVGDLLGSRAVAGRLVRDSMRLALLIARRYAPYSKWLGTAFARLADPDGLAVALAGATSAGHTAEREASLGAAYRLLGARFNALSPDLSVDTSLRPFFDRPALVLGADRFAAAALERVSDATLAGLPLVGSVDQLLDTTDILADPELTAAMRPFYRGVGFSGD